MTRLTSITVTAALLAGVGGALSGVAVAAQAPADTAPISAPMRTVLLPPIPPPLVRVPEAIPSAPAPAPAPPVVTSAVPAPAPPDTTTTTTTTTQPVAHDGPQPQTPGVTVQVPQCVVQWTTTETLPEPMPAPELGPDAGVPGPSTITVPDSYDGDCTTAQQVAAQHPGSTVQQVTLPETVDQADAPGGGTT